MRLQDFRAREARQRKVVGRDVRSLQGHTRIASPLLSPALREVLLETLRGEVDEASALKSIPQLWK